MDDSASFGRPGPRVVISLVILAVLFLQIVAASRLTFGPIEDPPFLYPFLDYPMYSGIHREGERITRHRIYAVLADSTEVRVDPADLGLSFWLFRRGPVQALYEENAEKLATYAEMYRSRHGVRVMRFRLEDRPVVLTSEGIREASSETLNEMSVSGS